MERMFFQAFSELSLRRLEGMNGARAIPVAEIAAWMDIKGITDQELRDSYLFYLTHLDAAFLDKINNASARR